MFQNRNNLCTGERVSTFQNRKILCIGAVARSSLEEIRRLQGLSGPGAGRGIDNEAASDAVLSRKRSVTAVTAII